MISGRISWIDICRGLGIILVIHGHTLTSDSYRYLIYAFHMPLFFFLSGLVFNYAKYTDLSLLIRKSIKGILIPYVFFALLSYFFWMLQNPSSISFLGSLQHLRGIIYGNSSSLFFNVVLWFLPCLFITKVSFGLLTKFFPKPTQIIAGLLFASLIGYYLSFNHLEVRLPFGAESALTAIVFFGIGSLWSRYHAEFFKPLSLFYRRHSFLTLFVFILILIVGATTNFVAYGEQIDLRLNHLGNYSVFYLAAFSGIISLCIMSSMIRKSVVLECLGRYSLVLFALHPIVFFYFTKLLTFFINQNTVSAMRSTYLAPVYTVISIFVILFLNYSLKKIRLAYRAG